MGRQPQSARRGSSPEARARAARAALLRRLTASAILTGLLAALWLLDREGWHPSPLRMAPGHAHAIVLAIVAATAFACAVAPVRWRRRIHVVAALAAWTVALRGLAVIPFGFAAAAIGLARAPGPLLARAVLVFAAWVTVPLTRVMWLDGLAQLHTIVLALLWAGLLYSALFLLVERARALANQRTSVVDDVFYLLALPRVVVPFFQPIAPSRLLRSERPGAPWPSIARGAGLAGYGIAVAVAAPWLARHAVALAEPWHTLVWFLSIYCRVTFTIFLAIAVFRLLGYDLPSGFRYPYASRSFAEFFRRFNHYVRDAVLSLFYFPILGHLRTRMSPRAASIIAAYVSILLGSFLLHDFLVPMALAIDPVETAHHVLAPVRVLGLVALWSLIILPNAGIAPRREPPRSWQRTAVSIAVFNLLHGTVWYLQHLA
jgi:hypothetical protein